MINYIYALLADLFFSSSFIIQKSYQQKTDTSVASGIIFSIISAAFLSLVFLCVCLFKPAITAYSLVSAFLGAAVVFGYTLASFPIIKAGSLSFYTLFLMTGGMIVPFIWGACFLGESISLMQAGGILLITFSIVLSSAEKKKTGFGIILLCILVFFLNGASSVISKLHQIETRYSTLGTYDYMFWGNVFRLAMALFLLPMAKGEKKAKVSSAALFIAFLAAATGGVASCFNLMGASNLPATVLYPLITGGTMVLSFVMDVIFYKEKLTVRSVLPVIISFAGTLMFL